MNLLTPWSIHEAEISLFAAWKDGLPMTGPGGRFRQTALLSCLASVTVSQTFLAGYLGIYDPTGSPATGEGAYSITLEFKDGVVSDDLSRLLTRLHGGGYHCLVIRFQEESGSGQWTKRQFFYVGLNADVHSASASARDAAFTLTRRLELRAGWMIETAGSSSVPSPDPEVFGEVEWICGPHRIPCLRFDPATLTWTNTEQNQLPDGSPPLVTLQDQGDGSVEFSTMLPRLTPGSDIQWEATMAAVFNGATVTGNSGFSLQANGTTEPLLTLPQDRVLDEPLVVFRYLRKVYFSIGHDCICIPSISADPVPDTHEPFFRISDLAFYPRGAFALT